MVDCQQRDMRVSPWHRLLICGQRAELMFGEYRSAGSGYSPGRSARHQREVAPQTYVHLMFEEHQIIRADGAWSESFQPGAKTLAGLGRPAARRIAGSLSRSSPNKPGRTVTTSARLSLKESRSARASCRLTLGYRTAPHLAKPSLDGGAFVRFDRISNQPAPEHFQSRRGGWTLGAWRGNLMQTDRKRTPIMPAQTEPWC